jgi:hypothetical protein
METFHIYDEQLTGKEFYYFFGTHIEEIDPWDTNSMYHGFLITTKDEVIPAKIPMMVYRDIPSTLKKEPRSNNYNRFKVSNGGKIVSRVT